MKNVGRARKAGFKLILISLIGVLIVLVLGLFTTFIGTLAVAVTPVLVVLWAVFSLFTIYFFRDPTSRVPVGARLVLSPAHAKVDVVDSCTETEFMGGPCQRISMFLSVLDVHVQNAPAGGKVSLMKYTAGQFLSAIRTESALHNENVLLGFELNDPPGKKVGVRLIAGVLARRIVPWVVEGQELVRGERISLIQFGSRAEVYLPEEAKIRVKVGDKVVGGETVLAVFE